MTLAGLLEEARTAPEHADKTRAGCLFPGELAATPGRRETANVATRTLLLLDYDDCAPHGWTPASMPWCSVAWTTHSATADAPRYRVVVPFDRPVLRDEWSIVKAALLARLTHGDMADAPKLDTSCLSLVQCMYRPARRPGAPELATWDNTDRPVLSVGDLLDEGAKLVPEARNQGGALPDPFEKPGAIGAFNRAYADLDELAEVFDLPYEPAGTRWKLAGSSSPAGVVELRPGYWYSHHGNDPASTGHAVNAFDLVRLHVADMVGTDDHGASMDMMDGIARADARVRDELARTDFLGVSDDPADPANWPDLARDLDDANLVEWMAHAPKGLQNEWAFAGGLGWMQWDGRRWVPRREEDAREAVRRVVKALAIRALQKGLDMKAVQQYNALRSSGRINSLTTLMRGVASVPPEQFDTRADLLNVGNGVVDLRTGELLPHDPAFHLTRITETPYVAGATHPDWDKALHALDPDVAEWMQVRFGQGATGYTTSDDVLPIGQGGGSNGKSTILTALFAAMGDHMTQVPAKLLTASPNDHPTELMTLRGARIAVVDETPEAANLNVPRLKATLGQSRMTARAIRQDNVTWESTHSLFVMTNYTPTVYETDHGTWRRLALVRFTKTFPKDDRFRAAMQRATGGRREAVLAWVVEGARRWYANERVIPDAPQRVADDTRAWREETDLVLGFVQERLVFDGRACVAGVDLFHEVNNWLDENGNQKWSQKKLDARFGSHSEITAHNVTKERQRKPEGLSTPPYGSSVGDSSEKVRIWRGIRWRTPLDEETSSG